MTALRLLTVFIAGALFAAGLAISGMTRPENVVGFLDITGDWRPELAFVMGGAILVHFVAQRLKGGLARPVLAPSFPGPPPKKVTRRLVGGAALFGMGWGLAGFCPGPALVAGLGGSTSVLLFVVAMLGGMVLVERVDAWRAARPLLAPAGTEPDHDLAPANAPFVTEEDRQVS